MSLESLKKIKSDELNDHKECEDFLIDIRYIRELLVLFWNMGDRENMVQRDVVLNQIRQILKTPIYDELELDRRNAFIDYLKFVKEPLFDKIEYKTFEETVTEKIPQSHKFNTFFVKLEEAILRYKQGDKFIEFQTDYHYQTEEELLNVNIHLPKFSDSDSDMNLYIALKACRNSLRRIKSNFKQLFILVRLSEIDVLKQALSQMFDEPLFLNIDLPDNYKLNIGIFDLIKNTLSDNEDGFEDRKFAIIFVNNYVKRAINSVFNGFQSYAHLYGQNTGEDIISAHKGEKNNKTFEHYNIKTLVITLIDDSQGRDMQNKVFIETLTNDFVDIIKIP